MKCNDKVTSDGSRLLKLKKTFDIGFEFANMTQLQKRRYLIMIYLVAILIPPLALLLEGKIFQAIINAVFWLLGLIFFILGGFLVLGITIIHAIIVVHGARSDARTQKIVDAINSNKED